MCEILVKFRDREGNEKKLMENVSRYEITDNTLEAYTIIGEKGKFKFKDIDKITWSEKTETLIIEGENKKIIKKPES